MIVFKEVIQHAILTNVQKFVSWSITKEMNNVNLTISQD